MLHQLRAGAESARGLSPIRTSVARRGSRRRSDLLWIGTRAIGLAGHLLDSVVRNSEIRRAYLDRCQEKYQQTGRLEPTFYERFHRVSKTLPRIWNRTNGPT